MIEYQTKIGISSLREASARQTRCGFGCNEWVNSAVAIELNNRNVVCTPGILQIVNLLLSRVAAGDPLWFKLFSD